jgi:regulator of sigma E protease
MNFIVAFAIFPIVYYAGVPVTRPVLGVIATGSPAWKAGIVPGSVVKSIDGKALDSFDELQIEVGLSSSSVKLVVDEPKAGAPGEYVEREIVCDTSFEPSAPMPRLGVDAARKIVVFTDRSGARQYGFPVEVEDGSAAHDAGVRDGDLAVAVDGVKASYAHRFAFDESLDRRGGHSAVWTFRPGDAVGRSAEVLARLEAGVAIVPRPIQGTERPMLGIFAASTVVKAVKPGGALERAGLAPGDAIWSVAGARFVQPMDLLRASVKPGPIDVEVLRSGARVKLTLDPPAAVRDLLWTEAQFEPSTAVVGVVPGLEADKAGIRSGDRLVRIGDVDVREFSDVLKVVAASEGKKVRVELERRLDGDRPLTERTKLDVTPSPVPVFDAGIRLLDDRTAILASSPVDACVKGFGASVKLIKQISFLLRKIALGDVPAKENLGGPISIAAQSYHVAQSGVIEFLRFLGLLSLNLALINLLPIPVLDGGNLLFVLVEAVKGSPVSDRVLGASQTVGVFLLIALMVWVTFHDVRRVFGLFS